MNREDRLSHLIWLLAAFVRGSSRKVSELVFKVTP